ncbi:Fur family transcriptional regulator [Bartonella tamiae]|uniref:Uncharacterized protein n=1 Tax=Bartonella tamiae Th239 TaxID=1094558 RepID=J0QTU6_9HYPH|nr:Fur family transcriptional regulator [Bartonella tamiae]EJF89331.1 hypothetical protein ME5_01882 [Bartonella tamiae Th239]EJF92804.1 hypothetical protein MEG_01974 [Bartonella tamiae Th307]
MVEKLTHNQALVLSVLQQAQAPLSAYTILDKLRGKGFRAPLQVYRALEKLVTNHHVHRLESINAFMACSHFDHGCHGLAAFAICDVCGNAAEIEDQNLSHHIQNMSEEIDFTTRQTTIEIRGLCVNCSKKT